MARLFSDLRFALRQILRSPGFAITAIVTLALAIGANTAIFTSQALRRRVFIARFGAGCQMSMCPSPCNG
jgi:hypothetical protein